MKVVSKTYQNYTLVWETNEDGFATAWSSKSHETDTEAIEEYNKRLENVTEEYRSYWESKPLIIEIETIVKTVIQY